VVHRVGERGKGDEDVERVTNAADYFVAGELQVEGHFTGMVSLDNPDAVVNDVLSLKPLHLEGSSCLKRHGGTRGNSCDVLKYLAEVRISTSGEGVVGDLLSFGQWLVVEEPMMSVKHPLVLYEQFLVTAPKGRVKLVKVDGSHGLRFNALIA